MDASARNGRHGDGDAREKAEDEDEADLAAAPPTSDDAPNTSGLDELVSEWTGQTAGKPQCYFIVHNIAKKHNVGTIARCATAFGVRSVVLIGSKSYNTFGCKGSSNHVDFAYYPTLKDARQGLTAEKKVTKILGVEICEGAVPIESHPFDGDTAFIMGNEVSLFLLSYAQLDIDDVVFCIYILFTGRRHDGEPEGHMRRVRVHPAARPGYRVLERVHRGVHRHAPLRAVGRVR
tara:strand:- start:145 stop:846 length:702 start_codon:yes stop_codon:yes gene_type:complete